MEIPTELVTLGTELATITGRMSVQAIFDKMKAVKQKDNKDEVISNLEEIISELIGDKNSLIRISQAYEEKLITQKMTETEIEYITTSVVPLLEELLKQSNNSDAEKIQDMLELLKQLLSKEMFNIMQILGFNFKKAIGEPLTELLASLIRTKINSTENAIELQKLANQRDIEFFKLCQNEKAYERVMNVYQQK